jgi:hypothetical protein
MIDEYDKNFMNFEEIDDEKFINSKNIIAQKLKRKITV